jgi:hypothetical protein
VDGKVDWMAYGLPVEGEDGPFIGDQVGDVPTCDVDATVAAARPLLPGPVVVVAEGLAVGLVEAGDLEGRSGDEPLIEVMQPVPSTYRPSVTVEALLGDGGGGRHLVSTPDGRLLGAVTVDAAHDHDHDHDHGIDHERFEAELTEVMEAVGQRFGDRRPSEEELRGFLRDRLVAEGRSEEDADRFLAQLES